MLDYRGRFADVSPQKPPRPAPEPVNVRMTPIAVIGTLLWTIAFVVAQLMRAELAEAGREWWIACAATGIVLGLIGTAVMVVFDRRHFGPKGRRD